MGTELGSGFETKEYGGCDRTGIVRKHQRVNVWKRYGCQSIYAAADRCCKSLRYAGDTPRGKVDFTVDQTHFAQGHDMCSVLYEVSGLDQGASVFGVDITRVSWNTQLYIGAAVDIAFLAFEARQTTSISDGKVLVKGTITNTSEQENTWNSTAVN